MKNKILSMFLALVLILTLLPANVVFAEVVASGTAWELDSDGVFTLKGNITTFYYSTSEVPWNSYKSQIKSIKVNSGVYKIPNFAFSDCAQITEFTMPNSISDMGMFAFKGCTNLTDITFSSSLKSIEQSTFLNCSKLKKVSLPYSVRYISTNGFSGCTSLEEISFSSNLYYTASGAFSNCSSLKELDLSNVTSIDDYGSTISGCSSLESIILPTKITKMPSLSGSSSLTKVLIPNKVTTSASMQKCTALKTVKILGKLTSLPNFSGCTSLEEVNIPTTVTSISSIFNGCNNLKKIYYGGSADDWAKVTISGNNGNLANAEIVFNCDTTAITSLNIIEDSVSLDVGEKETINAQILPEAAWTKELKWSSGDESVATIDCNGIVTAKSVGTTAVVVEDASGNFMDACILTVNGRIEPTGITLNKNSISLIEKETEKLTATILPNNATDKSVVWSSISPSVASVDASGTVTAISAGTTTIKATTSKGEFFAECQVTVEKLYNLTGIKFENSSISVAPGKTQTLNVIYTPENASYKDVTWSSNNTSVATINNGIVTGVSEGTAIIVATSVSGEYKATCIVKVEKSLGVESITLNKSSISLEKGKTETLIAKILPDYAENKSVEWSSNDESIATVDENGTVTAISAGDTKIIAKTKDGGFIAICDVVVLPVSVEGISFEKESISLYPGDTEELKYTIIPEDAYNKEVMWGTNNNKVAVVNDGVITAVSVGTAQIVATTIDGSYTAICTVTVSPIKVTGISISSELSVVEGQTGTITTTITPENATDKTVIWSTNDESIATVDNGVVTGVSAGTTVIIAKTNDGNFSEYCVVTVTAANVPTSGVLLNASTISLVEGYSDTLVATAKPDNATNKNIIWTSNNNAVATVDNGKVTAVAPGTAIIIATTEDGNHIATCIVTVSSVNQEVVSTPLASVLSGIVKENTSVILLSATRNAEIYYTLDGTAPSKQSTKYTSPITITAETKIKAIAVKAGMQDSNISTFNYTLVDPELPYVNVVTNVTGNKGDITTVSVNTTENSGMAGGSFNLVYDNTVVELVSVSGGNIISNANPVINDTYRENKIRVVWGGIREITAGGEILNVQFKILDTNSEATYFNLENVKMADGDSNKITLQSSDGILTINEAPTATAYEYYTESSINADNKSVNVNVFANSEQNGILIVAEYDKYGKLVQMKHTDVANVDNTYTINFDKAISTEAKIKMFVWSSFETMKPLSDVEEI